MFSEAFDLAPGEVFADRYDPADEASPVAQLTTDELTEWDTNPWF